MKYLFLVTAGVLVSFVHFYLVLPHRHKGKRTLSEHAVLSSKSHLIYFTTHVVIDVLFLLYSYVFFVKEQGVYAPFYLNVIFACFDFIQALLPSRGRTERVHWLAAYISWLCYLISGLLALLLLQISQPYLTLSILVLLPTLGLFLYMHVARSKLYPYQLAIVPMYAVYLLLITLGAY